jgi:peptidyl-prolyl cis-trans isomerase A (cyclophilin A)
MAWWHFGESLQGRPCVAIIACSEMTSISTESIKGNSSRAVQYRRKVVAAAVSFAAILIYLLASNGGGSESNLRQSIMLNKRQNGQGGGGGGRESDGRDMPQHAEHNGDLEAAGRTGDDVGGDAKDDVADAKKTRPVQHGTTAAIDEGEKDDGGPTSTSQGEGRLIEFTIANLDGEEGRTGTIKIQTHPEWAPIGVERFHELVERGFWKNCKFFRVVPNFMVQVGIQGDPRIQKQWRNKVLKDDPVKTSNARGMVSFATSGKDTRTTQIFLNTNTKGNAFLDKQGFSPFGEVVEGMEIVDRIYDGDREKPNQGMIQNQGNVYLDKEFPRLSYFSGVSFV